MASVIIKVSNQQECEEVLEALKDMSFTGEYRTSPEKVSFIHVWTNLKEYSVYEYTETCTEDSIDNYYENVHTFEELSNS